MVSVVSRQSEEETRNRRVSVVWVYGAWSFLASLLIFWVELMVAKMLLPRFGGSPSVWNTSLVFFQLNLLAGYAAAHFLARLDSRVHKVIQIVLVAVPILTLPVSLPVFLENQGFVPTVAVLVALSLMIGAPFFALATSTPTLQAWFAHSDHKAASDPYFLYALSNVGSVVGLLGYPLLIERVVTLRGQAVAWAIGYGVFVLLTLVGSRLVGAWGPPIEEVVAVKPSLRRRLRWAGLAFVPSLALLGVTRHLSTDVAAFPLLWTVPLAIYLASFVVTFRNGSNRWTSFARVALRPVIVLAAILGLRPLPGLLWLTVGAAVGLLALVSVAAHGRVYQERPEVGGLTGFYLWVSIGGAAGGLFASLLAPVIFDSVVEYSLTLILAPLLVGRPIRDGFGRRSIAAGMALALVASGVFIGDAGGRALVFGLGGVIAVLYLRRVMFTLLVASAVLVASAAGPSGVLATERTFFGVYRVHETEGARFLTSGTTNHGSQLTGQTGAPKATGYYHPAGPVGDIFRSMPSEGKDVGVVGLGIGALVAYADPSDQFTFYEIDPAVERIARDERFFTLLSEADALVDVVIGDGRLELEHRRPQHDLLIVDAFSSDSIPVHLMTVEAFRTFFDSIGEDGVLLVHVSNRHLQLEPVVGRIAAELGLSAKVRRFVPTPDIENATASIWIELEKAPKLDLPPSWVALQAGASLWTDDYSNILSVIDWN